MATDIMGLLTGVSKQGINPMLSQLTPAQQRMEFGRQSAQGLQRAIGGMFGGGAPIQEQIQAKLTESILGFENKTLQEQQGLIRALQATGQTGLAGQLAGRLEQKQLDQQKQQELNLNADVVKKLYPDLPWAAEFAQRGVDLKTIKELAADTNKDRMDTLNWVQTTYGNETADSLRPVILNGSVKPQDVPKLIPDKAKKDGIKNFVVQNEDGSRGIITVMSLTDGSFEDLQGNPIVLPKSAQLQTVGKTAQDMAFTQDANGNFVAPLSNEERKRIVKELTEEKAKVKELKEINMEELVNSLTFMGKTKKTIGGLSSFFQISDLTEGTGLDFLDNVSEYLTDLEDFGGETTVILDVLEAYFQNRRHDITGAQAALAELAQLRKYVLSAGSNPNEAKSRIMKLIQRADDDILRMENMLKNNQLSFSAYQKGSSVVEEQPTNTQTQESTPTTNTEIINNFFKKYQ